MTDIYEPGNRARCIVCLEELAPAPSSYDGEPAYCGFLPCPDHPKAAVIYRHEVTGSPPAPAIGVTPRLSGAMHQLKTWPRWFVPAWAGLKPFEVRNNDRNFMAGDYVLLEEWDPDSGKYTGRQIQGKITYVLPGGPLNGLPGEGGLGSGWCVFGYMAISRTISR